MGAVSLEQDPSTTWGGGCNAQVEFSILSVGPGAQGAGKSGALVGALTQAGLEGRVWCCRLLHRVVIMGRELSRK